MTFARTLCCAWPSWGAGIAGPRFPDWVLSAPPAAVMAISCRAGWALEQPRLLSLLEPFPLARQSLDLFLQRARLDLRQETGRVTVFFIQSEPARAGRQGFLIQLGGFRDPGAAAGGRRQRLSGGGRAVHEQPGSSPVRHHRRPAHPHPRHGRRGGPDLAGRRGHPGRAGFPSRLAPPALAASSGWISGAAAVQGFIRPQELRDDTVPRLPGDLARDLPRGIESVSWGLSPGAAPEAAIGFELALAGSPEAVERASSWLQRFLEAASAVPGAPGAPPEILQESRCIGLRCRLTQDQVDLAMAKLDQPPMPLPIGKLDGLFHPVLPRTPEALPAPDRRREPAAHPGRGLPGPDDRPSSASPWRTTWAMGGRPARGHGRPGAAERGQDLGHSPTCPRPST